jgi:small subunit ribosomal protein S21
MYKVTNVSVENRPNESFERMLKRFVKKIKKDGILEEVRDRRYYVKPSVKKRLKRIRARALRSKQKSN